MTIRIMLGLRPPDILSGMKPVGLTLAPEDYDRLKRYADARHWSLALAARVIVLEHLTQNAAPGEGP